jgi:hypothetical protein
VIDRCRSIPVIYGGIAIVISRGSIAIADLRGVAAVSIPMPVTISVRRGSIRVGRCRADERACGEAAQNPGRYSPTVMTPISCFSVSCRE